MSVNSDSGGPCAPSDSVERLIRRFAGGFILTSLLLAWWVDPKWLAFTAFVGLNLLQSSFTGVCPLEMILRARQRRARQG
jgi:Inner membrane protein YgaP-like, transmembrane domain